MKANQKGKANVMNPNQRRRCAITHTTKTNREQRIQQTMTEFELRGMPGFTDSWDYRVLRDDSPEIFGNLSFRPVDRILAESNEFYDILDKDGRCVRLIKKRDPEMLAHPLQELEAPDEDDIEDAMDAVDPNIEVDEHTGELTEHLSVPRDQWDLVFWTEPRRFPNGSIGKVERSAPVWPRRRWNKSMQDSESIKRAEFMLNQLRRGRYENGRVFYQEVNKLQREDRGPLWRAYKLRKKDLEAFRKQYGDPQ